MLIVDEAFKQSDADRASKHFSTLCIKTCRELAIEMRACARRAEPQKASLLKRAGIGAAALASYLVIGGATGASDAFLTDELRSNVQASVDNVEAACEVGEDVDAALEEPDYSNAGLNSTSTLRADTQHAPSPTLYTSAQVSQPITREARLGPQDAQAHDKNNLRRRRKKLSVDLSARIAELLPVLSASQELRQSEIVDRALRVYARLIDETQRGMTVRLTSRSAADGEGLVLDLTDGSGRSEAGSEDQGHRKLSISMDDSFEETLRGLSNMQQRSFSAVIESAIAVYGTIVRSESGTLLLSANIDGTEERQLVVPGLA